MSDGLLQIGQIFTRHAVQGFELQCQATAETLHHGHLQRCGLVGGRFDAVWGATLRKSEKKENLYDLHIKNTCYNDLYLYNMPNHLQNQKSFQFNNMQSLVVIPVREGVGMLLRKRPSSAIDKIL